MSCWMIVQRVSKKFMPQYIQVVIVGVGWLHDRGYVMNVTNASKPFSESLHGIFNSHGLKGRITEQNNAYRVWVSGKQDVRKLADWLYVDAGELFLERKRKSFYGEEEVKTAS